MNNKLAEFTQTLNLTFGPAQRVPMWPPKTHRPKLPRAFIMTDEERLSDPLSLLNKLPRGVAVIFRHYNCNSRQNLARKVVESAHRCGVKVLISGDAHLARNTDADGVHLPSYMLKMRNLGLFTNIPHHWLITAAIHNNTELNRAMLRSVNALLISPVFATNTRIQRPPLGIIGLRRLAHSSRTPAFALGGLNLSILTRIKRCGTAGFAGVSEFQKLIVR